MEVIPKLCDGFHVVCWKKKYREEQIYNFHLDGFFFFSFAIQLISCSKYIVFRY